MTKLDLEGLNTNQREAVEWDKGPLLVLAGPGSGKTRVLTMRVAKLILDSPDQRFRVLGLTFTTKAADEMRSRVDDLVFHGRERALLATFHSFCADVLRQHGSHVGIDSDFQILNQDGDRESVLSDAIKVLQKKNVEVEEEDIRVLPFIDKFLENCVGKADVRTLVKDKDLGQKLEKLYVEYRRQLQVSNRLDCPSLLYCTYELLTKVPAVGQQLRLVYEHVCVDEFQDTNLAQYRLLEAIVGKNAKTLFVVADDDQMIYQWNGASPERLKELRNDFNMHVIQLPANYRCPPAVISIANALIRHNVERAEDKEPLYAVKKGNAANAVRVNGFDSLKGEVAWIAKDILKRPHVDRGKCVVLARTKKILEQALGACEAAGLKASMAVRKHEFESVPLRWLHAMLRLANARGDREQLRRVCKSFYELEGINIEVQDVVAHASVLGGDLLRAWVNRALERTELEPETKRCLRDGRDLIVERMEFSAFVRRAFKWCDTVGQREAGDNESALGDYESEKMIWNDLERQVNERFGSDQVTLQILLQEFDLSPKSPPISPDAIRCLTIHSAKGMEFEHVYLIGMVEDLLPSFQSIKKGPKSREMEEERRNCFVAITRSQSTLTMTHANEYFGWQKQPSRFLREMGLLN